MAAAPSPARTSRPPVRRWPSGPTSATCPARPKPRSKRTLGHPTATGARLSPYKRAQRAASLEQRIEALEVKLVDLSGAIGEASAAGDAGSVHDLGQQYTQAEADLEAAMLEWEDLLAQD